MKPTSAKAVDSRPVCPGVVAGSSGLSTHLHYLLRSRLRVASIIGLAGFSLFWLKGFFVTNNDDATTRIMHTCVVAIQVMTCTFLWSYLPACQRSLRILEGLLFGSAAFFFAWLQIQTYMHGQCFEGVSQGYEEKALSLHNAGTAIRWYVLIMLYGAFIPNTWTRCATVVGIMALTPLLLTLLVFQPCPVMGKHMWSAMFDMTVVLSLAASTAIFGSYKINELQTEAHKARQLGQYVLKQKLGAGGMGEVYLAEHRFLRRTCALKLIRSEQAGDPNTLSRFEREVQSMAGLTHWNTVEVYDYGRAEDGTFYYVMEYLPGKSLQEIVEEHGPLSPGRAIHFLRQLCAALTEAHQQGLIHRDIKPSNVLVCRRGGVYDVAKLLDFGLVHAVGMGAIDEKLTMQGTILGSPQFISPEQAKGRTDIDGRADIYGLGGLAYFLVTGRTPFQRESVMELLASHLYEKPTPPREHQPELPADLEEVILTCLQKKIEDRYPGVKQLDAALADCESAMEWDNEQAEQWWLDVDLIDTEQPELVAVK